MSIAEFSINEKDKEITIKIKGYDRLTIVANIEEREKDFYKKLRCIWQLNLPSDIKSKICKEYGKICGQTILFEDEIEYTIDKMMEDILDDEYLISMYYDILDDEYDIWP
ncbi:unnamed protein product [Trifolium pratense]|uniref:Uncharacterized protein n=1 Tax=Trifolium pratense TaxID=57577 RepID=A0ACB0J9Z0_TRIPR|nr:unnamed protein product [Trifolium pratense]